MGVWGRCVQGCDGAARTGVSRSVGGYAGRQVHGKVSTKASGAGGVRVPFEALEGGLGLHKAGPVHSFGGLILATALIPKAPA